MTEEYKPVVRERPDHLETKSTVDSLIGYAPSPVPHSSRSGGSLTDDEREDATVFPGTFAAGNGVQNSEAGRKRGGSGLATDSGGTQSKAATSRRSTSTATKAEAPKAEQKSEAPKSE